VFEVSGVRVAPTTTLTSSLKPSSYGQELIFTATVTASGSLPPTGTVAFTWGGGLYTIGKATRNSSGVATLIKSNLNADTYPLNAVYKGDANNLGSWSPVLNQLVLQATSAATLTSSPNPSTPGEAVTFTAKITSPTVIPTGPVTFTAGKTVLGTAQLSSGKAKLTISSLAVGQGYGDVQRRLQHRQEFSFGHADRAVEHGVPQTVLSESAGISGLHRHLM
jgi:Bacterial Ig-like domain (group 3)